MKILFLSFFSSVLFAKVITPNSYVVTPNSYVCQGEDYTVEFNSNSSYYSVFINSKEVALGNSKTTLNTMGKVVFAYANIQNAKQSYSLIVPSILVTKDNSESFSTMLIHTFFEDDLRVPSPGVLVSNTYIKLECTASFVQEKTFADAELVSVVAYNNLMPTPGPAIHKRVMTDVTTKVISNGCTKPQDFVVKIIQVNDKKQVLSIQKIKTDHCKMVPRPVQLSFYIPGIKLDKDLYYNNQVVDVTVQELH